MNSLFDELNVTHYRYTSHDRLLYLATMLIVVFTVIRTKCPSKFIRYFFDVNKILFKQNLSRVLNDNVLSNRIIMSAWLFAATSISINFSNYVLEQKVVTVPDKVIDSWQDLHDNPDIEIAAVEQDTLVKFARDMENDMARDFWKRLTRYKYQAWFNDDVLLRLAENMTIGQTAIIKSKITLEFLLLHMSQLIANMSMDYNSFLDSIHISEHGAWNLPFFIPSLRGSQHPYFRHLNKM